jgi:hypothetical protein
MRKLLLATTLLAFPALAYAQAIGSLSTLPQFTVNVTGFTAPNGQPWNAHGLNVDLGDALQNLKGIVQNYPGMSMARVVANGNTDTLANIDPIVQAYTSKGIVVELEDHADSQNGNNTGWYSMLANAYKNNPYVFLETPNEPSDPNTAQNQINIIKAIRATGFNNPIGIQPIGGFNESNLSAVTSAVGIKNLYVTPHIYGSPWQQSAIDGAKAAGLYPVIDEFGNAMDGFTIDAQGQAVIDGVIAANESGEAGAIFWAAGNGYHTDGADSAFLDPAGTQLSSTGQYIKSWLSGPVSTAFVNFTPNTGGPTEAQGQQAVQSSHSLSVADVANLASQGTTSGGLSISDVVKAAAAPPGIPQAISQSAGIDPGNPQPIVLASNAPTGTMPTPAPATNTISLDASGTNQTVTAASGNSTGNISGNGNSVTAVGGIAMLDITGVGNTITTGQYDDSVTVSSTGNTIDLGAGRNTITLDYKKLPSADIAAISSLQIAQDEAGIAPLTRAGNLFVAPQPGMGILTIQGSQLAKKDQIDLTKALAGVAGWDHNVADISKFVTIGSATGGTEISVQGQPIVVLTTDTSNPFKLLTAR